MNQSLVAPPSQDMLALIEKELYLDPRLRSQRTRDGYLIDLRGFEAWRAGQVMTKTLVDRYASFLLSREHAPASINRALAAIRWWARRLSDLAHEWPLAAAEREEWTSQAARVASIKDLRSSRLPVGRHIPQEELHALLRACQEDRSHAGIRDATAFVLGWCTGTRRSELCGAHLADLLPGPFLRILGKGDKQRDVPINAEAQVWIARWRVVRGPAQGPLLCPVRKGGRLGVGFGLSDVALGTILDKRQSQAGLSSPLTWHDFRRTFAGNLLDAGVDLVTVQKLLGHSNPATTSRYDRRGEKVQQRAVDKITVDF